MALRLLKDFAMHLIPFRGLRQALRRTRKPLGLLARHAPSSLELRTVVHVGAHLGQERHRYEELGYRDILWIEASESVHAELATILSSHMAELKAAGVTSVRHRSVCALMTDTDGAEVALREFSNHGASSSIFSSTNAMRARWPEVRETGRTELYRTQTLDALLDGLGFGQVDLLVADVQGAELLVLKGAQRTLATAKAVICEVSTTPLYEGGVLYPELAAFLEAHGFEPMSTPRFHCDMLFVHPGRAGFRP